MAKTSIFSLDPHFLPFGCGGSKKGSKPHFGDFSTIFYGFPRFTGKNECAYRVQTQKSLKIHIFSLVQKVDLILLHIVQENVCLKSKIG